MVASPAVVADPAEEALLAGPVVAVQPLPEGVARGAARCLHSGRPWDYITQRGATVLLDADDSVIYCHRDQSLLGYSATMERPLAFLDEVLAQG